MNLPLVTIGLPFYNSASTLELAIESIIAQTYPNWNLLLINDGSNDGSLQIAQEYQKRYNNITVLNDNENRGLISRLNQIIDLAVGEFLCRMDSDDVMMPERLSTQISTFEINPHLNVVSSGTYVVDQNLEPVGKRNLFLFGDYTRRHLLKKSIIVHPSVMARTAWFKMNKYDDNFTRAEDFELWVRTYDFRAFYNIPIPLMIYREGKVSVDKYLMTLNSLSKVLNKYGPLHLNRHDVIVEKIKIHLKGLMFRFAGAWGQQSLLTRLRNNGLSLAEANEVTNYIKELSNGIK